MLHPAWQRRAYPVTFFTSAPLEVLQAAIAGVEAERAAALAAEGGTGRPAPDLELEAFHKGNWTQIVQTYLE